MLSSAYSAEYGRNSGAQILVVSQNGTNEFHGSAFFKYNNPGLNAFNKLGTTVGASGFGPAVRVENRFRQYGGSFGGPLHLPNFGEGGPAYISGKNRLFFFLSYEGLRESATTFSNQFVETPEFRGLIALQRSGSVTAAVLGSPGITPRIATLLSANCATLFPNANDRAARCRDVPGGLDIGSLTGQIGQYVSLGNPTGGGFDGIPDLQLAQIFLPRTTEGNQYNARFDYTGSKNTFAFSTFITKLQTLNSDSDGQGRPGADLLFEPLNTSATVTFIRTISPTVINEARANVTRFFADQVKSLENTNLGVPRVEVEGLPLPSPGRIRFGAPRGENTPAIFAQNTYEVRDTLTWVRGSQAFKFGGEIRWEQNNSNAVGGARPLFSFSGLFNLANDTPIFEAITTDPAHGSADRRPALYPLERLRLLRAGRLEIPPQPDLEPRRALRVFHAAAREARADHQLRAGAEPAPGRPRRRPRRAVRTRPQQLRAAPRLRVESGEPAQRRDPRAAGRARRLRHRRTTAPRPPCSTTRAATRPSTRATTSAAGRPRRTSASRSPRSTTTRPTRRASATR